MRWKGRRGSDNIEDRRNSGGGRGGRGGGMFKFPFPGGGACKPWDQTTGAAQRRLQHMDNIIIAWIYVADRAL